jgi:hypothetical protein
MRGTEEQAQSMPSVLAAMTKRGKIIFWSNLVGEQQAASAGVSGLRPPSGAGPDGILALALHSGQRGYIINEKHVLPS